MTELITAITAFIVLCALFDPDEIVRFRIFSDRKDDDFPGAKLECKCSEYRTIEPELRKHNLLNRAISFVVNFGGQIDKEITRINAQFVEMDYGTFEQQRAKILAFPLRPSMVIRTRKSYHVYWFLKQPAIIEWFRPIQQRLVKLFGGDPNCVNESRAMRLPGFLHCKEEPVEVVCVCWHPERRYTQEQLMDVLPELAPTPVVRREGADRGIEHIMSGCDFLKYCVLNAAALSEPLWYAMITNLAQFKDGARLIHEYSAPYPGYSERNTQKKINHFLDSGTGPMNCKTICERGFQCPKYASGQCGVRAPAELSTKPMSVDNLRDILNKITLTGDVIKDLQLARDYVEVYLYNQDPATAEGLIRQDVIQHFRLTAASAASLKRIYKEACKEWKASRTYRQANSEEGLPSWYAPGKYGLVFLPGVLAEYMAKNYPVIYAAEQYYIYKDGVYVAMSDAEARAMILEKMLTDMAQMKYIQDSEYQWRLLARRDPKELNCNQTMINVRNGLYNVMDHTLSAHTSEYYSTIQLALRYDEDAECPRFKAFLEEVMCGDMEQVQLIQEILGYCLIPGNLAQKCFLFVGVGAAGKSVLLRVISDVLLGRENVSNVSWQALNDKFKTAELVGKLANIFADLPTKNIDDNGIFKALVGEDALTVERKFKDPFSFYSDAKLLFSCNIIPKNYGDRSDGFYRRLIIIRFNRAVPENQRDPNLLDKFRVEADGIFQFALEGLRRLMTNRYQFSVTDVNKEELERYREESDSVLLFLRECCELDADKAVGSSEIYEAYKSFCEDNGQKPCARNKFVQQVKIAYPDVTGGVDTCGKRRVLKGIRLGEMLG